MANVSEDVLRIIGRTRAWVKSYPVAAALARNPKTPGGAVDEPPFPAHGPRISR